jgi:hypothetical protein
MAAQDLEFVASERGAGPWPPRKMEVSENKNTLLVSRGARLSWCTNPVRRASHGGQKTSFKR